MAEGDVKLRQRLAELEDEVFRLEQRLADVHAADVNALDRAHKTLCQHVDALESDAKGMSEGIQDIETDLITPDSIADEVCAIGLVAGGMLALHRAIATLAPYRELMLVYKGCAAAGVAYVGWRLTSSAFKRLAAVTTRNRRRKQELLNIWEGIAERIQIMHSLASTRPVIAHSEEEQQPAVSLAVPLQHQQQTMGMQDLPNATAPPLPAP